MNNIISLLIIIGWISFTIILALICKNKFPYEKELTRKIIHIGSGPIIAFAWWLNIPRNLAISAALIITIALIVNSYYRIIAEIEDIERKSIGTIAYGLSITLLLIFYWPDHAAAATAGILFMAFGDGLAGLIGRKFQSNAWFVFGQRKSIYGTTTMGMVGILILLLISTLNGSPIIPLKIISLALIATSLEQISNWGIDNLTVPLTVGYLWDWMTTI